MPYKKNDPKINRAGRPKGSQNKTTTDLRQRITELMEKNFANIEAEFNKLDSEKRLIVLERYLKYCLPPLQSLNIQADIKGTLGATEIKLIRAEGLTTGQISTNENEIEE